MQYESKENLLLRKRDLGSVSLPVKELAHPPQSLSLNGTKPNKIKQRCSRYLLSSLRMFSRWLLFFCSQHEKGWYFGLKLGNVIFWQNPPMSGNSHFDMVSQAATRLSAAKRAPLAWGSKMWWKPRPSLEEWPAFPKKCQVKKQWVSTFCLENWGTYYRNRTNISRGGDSVKKTRQLHRLLLERHIKYKCLSGKSGAHVSKAFREMYREQTRGCQSGAGWGMGEIDEGD